MKKIFQKLETNNNSDNSNFSNELLVKKDN